MAFTLLTMTVKPVTAGAEESEGFVFSLSAEEKETSELALLRDDDINTIVDFEEGTTLKVEANEPIKAIYILFDAEAVPGEWDLTYNGKTRIHGQEGFLHEYVEFKEEVTECELGFNKPTGICGIYAFPNGEIPENVQQWKKLPKDADILIFAPHEGDEIIDFGAVEAIYAGQKNLNVQVVYMCEYVTTEEKIKEHEKLDSLWKLGVKYYPETGHFRNKVLTKEDQAIMFYGYGEVLEFATELIRKYRPLVVICPGHEDQNGNATHILLSDAVSEAVNYTQDNAYFSASAEEYGTWNVPKTYMHKKADGKLVLDMGNGVKELLKETYESRMTDSWCGTYIKNAKFDLADAACFGIYRTTVGTDTGNDIMENLVTYGEQARIAEEKEAERLRLEELERQMVYYDSRLTRAAEKGGYVYGKFLSQDFWDLFDKITANEWE